MSVPLHMSPNFFASFVTPVVFASFMPLWMQELKSSKLVESIGITESAISHHMRGLRQMRIVRARREGKEVLYSVIDSHIVALFQQGVRHVQEE